MDHANRLVAADLAAALPRLRRYARVLMAGWDGADELDRETIAGAWRKKRARPPQLDLVTWLGLMMPRTDATFDGTRRVGSRRLGRGATVPTIRGQLRGVATADMCTRVLRRSRSAKC
jgi:hypothetical protein